MPSWKRTYTLFVLAGVISELAPHRGNRIDCEEPKSAAAKLLPVQPLMVECFAGHLSGMVLCLCVFVCLQAAALTVKAELLYGLR